MKWRSEEKRYTRARKAFLILPKTINGETRWMEWATWSERDYNRPGYFGWKPLCWEDA
jgi:hypothetical protein